MIIEHLEKNIGDPTTVFYFPGYLVPGTLGYALANESQSGGQQKRVTIESRTGKKQYEVKARMKQFNFLSGHGDAEDLRAWLGVLKLQKDSNVIVVHGDVNGSSLEFKHSLERHGGFAEQNVIVPGIEEENFFPFDQIDRKKSQKIRKTTRGPLVIEAAPVRKKISPSEIPKKKPKKKKPELIETQIINTQKPINGIRTAIKTGSKVFSERKRYSELVRTAQDEYNNFYCNLGNISLPFLDAVKQYYRNKEVCTISESSTVSQQTQLTVLERRLYDAQNPKETLKRKKVIDIAKTQEEISSTKAKVLQFSEELKGHKKNLKLNIFKEKISANILSKGIIESLGYTTTQIPAHTEIIPIESESFILQIAREVFIRVLEYDSKTAENGYHVFADICNIRKIKQDSTGDYSIEDKKLLSKLDGVNIRSVLDTSQVILMGKINSNYSISIKPKKVPVKTLETSQNIK